MLTNDQKALLKRAQSQAALGDDEYRDSLALVSGMTDCRSSTDRRLTDEHLDNLMSYFEAIYWRKVDAGELQFPINPRAVFLQRGYWAAKNQRDNTSRDRYTIHSLQSEITHLEQALAAHGCGAAYCSTIRSRVGSPGIKYVAALKRTLAAKQRQADCPF